MEKIDTDYKRQTWKLYGNFFKMHERWSDSLNKNTCKEYSMYLVHLAPRSDVGPSLLVFQSPWRDFEASDPAVAAERKIAIWWNILLLSYNFAFNPNFCWQGKGSFVNTNISWKEPALCHELTCAPNGLQIRYVFNSWIAFLRTILDLSWRRLIASSRRCDWRERGTAWKIK